MESTTKVTLRIPPAGLLPGILGERAATVILPAVKRTNGALTIAGCLSGAVSGVAEKRMARRLLIWCSVIAFPFLFAEGDAFHGVVEFEAEFVLGDVGVVDDVVGVGVEGLVPGRGGAREEVEDQEDGEDEVRRKGRAKAARVKS